MLRNASTINGYAIAASDGQIGTVSDFLFDDIGWMVRWLEVDTGNWLSGRKVLLPPSVLGHLDPEGKKFSVTLTMQQVKDSPEIDTDRPVSRQMETDIYDYYGWSPYSGWRTLHGRFRLHGRAMVASRLHGRSATRAAKLPMSGEATTIRISAASKRSPGTISMPAMARSVTSKISSSRMPIGASITSSSIRRTGGPGRRF